MRSRLRPDMLRGPILLALAVETSLGCARSPSTPGDIEAHLVVAFFPQGEEPSGYQAARAVVKDASTGRAITDAHVEVNHVPLTYDSVHQQYEGSVRTADFVNASIDANGASLQSFAEGTAGRCTIEAPAVLHRDYPVVVRWTWNRAPDGPQGMALLDPEDVNGPLVWPQTRPGHMVTGSDFIGASLEPGTGPEVWRADMTVPSSPGPVLLVVEGLVAGSTFDDSPRSDLGIAAVCGTEVHLDLAHLVGLTIEGPSEVPDTPGTAVGNGLAPAGWFRVMGHFTDGPDQEVTDAVGWTVAPGQVVDLHSNGSFDTLGPGSVGITAAYREFSASTTLVVTPAPQSVSVFTDDATVVAGGGLILPEQFQLHLGLMAQYGTGERDVTRYATWFSSNTSVATIDAFGNVTTGAPGYAGINGSYGAKTGSFDIQVIDWIVRPTGTWDVMNHLLWTGTQFVAVGGTSTLTSPDGVQWSTHPLPPDFWGLGALTWTGTQLVAIGTQEMFTSPDGVTWASHAPLPSRTDGVSYQLRSIAGSSTRVVAAGDGAVLTSPDGAAWTLGPWWVAASTVLWSGSRFLVVDPGALLASSDGVTWKIGDNPGLPQALATDGTRMVGVGGGELFTSTDGLTWATTSVDPSINPTRLYWTGSEFLAVEQNGSVLRSPDGASWTVQAFSVGLGEIAASPQRTVVLIGNGPGGGHVMTRP